MIIIPNRTMFLDGKRVERAKAVEVSKDEGELALRHGWAVEGDAKEAKKAAKAAAEAEAAAKAAAEAEAAAKAAAEAEAAAKADE